MKIKNIVAVWLVTFILVSCVSTPKVVPTETAALRWGISTDNWKEYSSHFTSDVGTIEYNLRYPSDWYVYPGSTTIDPRLSGHTDIQSFARMDDSYQVARSVQLEINAFPCTSLKEVCDIDGLPILVSHLPGIRQVDVHDDGISWNVFLYTKDYRFSLYGRMFGTPEENKDNIQVLDTILSTIIIK